jgi:hypothetical protein
LGLPLELEVDRLTQSLITTSGLLVSEGPPTLGSRVFGLLLLKRRKVTIHAGLELLPLWFTFVSTTILWAIT